MKVKELMKLLKVFKNADILINNKNIYFEAYEDQTGRMVVNFKTSLEKSEKNLDESEKIQYTNNVISKG